jgi:hypothetical protein
MSCWTGLTDSARKKIICLAILFILCSSIVSYLIYLFVGHMNDFGVCVSPTPKKCTSGHIFGSISMAFALILNSFYAVICLYKIWSTIDENPSTVITTIDMMLFGFYFMTNMIPFVFSVIDILSNYDWNIYILCGNLIPIVIITPLIVCIVTTVIFFVLFGLVKIVITPYEIIRETYQIINQRKTEKQVSWYWSVLTPNAKKDILIHTAIAFGNTLLVGINVYIIGYTQNVYEYVNSIFGLGGLYGSMIIEIMWIIFMFYFIWKQIYYNYEELQFNWKSFLWVFGISHALNTASICLDNVSDFQLNFGFMYVHLFIPSITIILICGMIIFLLIQCFKCCHAKVTETCNIIKNREAGFVRSDSIELLESDQ